MMEDQLDRMNCYIVSLRCSPGLAKEFTLLGDSLADEGFDISYLLSSGYIPFLQNHSSISHFFSNSTTVAGLVIEFLKAPLKELPEINRLFQERRPGVLMIYSPHPLNAALLGIAKRVNPEGVRTIYLHEPYVPDPSSYGYARAIYIRLGEWLQGLALKCTTTVILPSEHAAKLFGQRYSEYRREIHLAPILLPERPTILPSPRRYLSFIGNINQSRGLDEFLALVEYSATRDESFHYQIITRSSISSVLDRLALLDREKLVVINKPVISEEEIAAALEVSKAVFLSHKQAAQSGLIPLAYRHGVPVLARNISGLAQHVRHGETGFLYPYEASPSDLLEGLRFIDTNFEMLSRNARREFEKEFSVENWERYYGWLIS